MQLHVTIESPEIRRLERWAALAGDAGRRASFRGRKRAAHRIVRKQKRAAPVDQGILRDSIHAESHMGPPTFILSALAKAANFDYVATIADTVYAARQEKEHEGRQERKLYRSRTPIIIKADPTPKKGYMRKTAYRNRAIIAREVAAELRRALA